MQSKHPCNVAGPRVIDAAAVAAAKSARMKRKQKENRNHRSHKRWFEKLHCICAPCLNWQLCSNDNINLLSTFTSLVVGSFALRFVRFFFSLVVGLLLLFFLRLLFVGFCQHCRQLSSYCSKDFLAFMHWWQQWSELNTMSSYACAGWLNWFVCLWFWLNHHWIRIRNIQLVTGNCSLITSKCRQYKLGKALSSQNILINVNARIHAYTFFLFISFSPTNEKWN